MSAAADLLLAMSIISKQEHLIASKAGVGTVHECNPACEVMLLNALLGDAESDAVRLADRVEALERLLVCYRINKRPPESLHRMLEKTEGAQRLHLQRIGDVP